MQKHLKSKTRKYSGNFRLAFLKNTNGRLPCRKHSKTMTHRQPWDQMPGLAKSLSMRMTCWRYLYWFSQPNSVSIWLHMKFACTFSVAKYSFKDNNKDISATSMGVCSVSFADFQQSFYVSITYILLIQN